jgi:DNA-directed RNA polymerase sigma subunit (sigma70/sigma32)
MEKIGSEINRLTGQDLTIDVTPTAHKLKQLANSKEVQLLDPSESSKLLRMADDLEKNGLLKLSDAEAMNQFINDTLKSTTSTASEAYKRGLQILV